MDRVDVVDPPLWWRDIKVSLKAGAIRIEQDGIASMGEPELASQLVVLLASGKADVLSGRFLSNLFSLSVRKL